jgi:hypothetical protein
VVGSVAAVKPPSGFFRQYFWAVYVCIYIHTYVCFSIKHTQTMHTYILITFFRKLFKSSWRFAEFLFLKHADHNEFKTRICYQWNDFVNIFTTKIGKILANYDICKTRQFMLKIITWFSRKSPTFCCWKVVKIAKKWSYVTLVPPSLRNRSETQPTFVHTSRFANSHQQGDQVGRIFAYWAIVYFGQRW